MESPFPVNCLYDPAELLTVQQNKSVLFIRPMDIYKKLTGLITIRRGGLSTLDF